MCIFCNRPIICTLLNIKYINFIKLIIGGKYGDKYKI